MKMKKILILILFISNTIIAQKKTKTRDYWDYRVGIGKSLHGSGDVIALNFENTLTYHFTEGFSTSLTYSTSSEKRFSNNNHWLLYNKDALDLMFHQRLWSNQNNNFEIGVGGAYLNTTSLSVTRFQNITNTDNYEINTFGIRYAVAYKRALSTRFFITPSLYQAIYFDDIVTGYSVRVGYKFD